MRKNISMPEQQKASKHQSSQQHKSVLNMNSHTSPTGVGVPTCVQNKGRADNHPRQHSKQPVVQFDFCFFKTLGEKETTPILTGIDVETGMSMAVLVNNKTADCQYHVQCIQTFLMECGRVQAVLNSTILQSDQEDHLIALLRTTAAKMGGDITVRQAPTYTSQAQGSVERFHRTLMGQNRNTEVPTTKQLRHQAHKQKSHRSMDGETHSIPAQQVCHTLRWQHKLLQKMAQRTQNTTL